MSLDIRRVRVKPFKQFDQPQSGGSWLAGKKIFAELINRALRALILASAFILPAWVWDFGAASGSGRVLALTALFGLIVLLWSLSALWLGSPSTLRRPFLTKAALALALLALLSAIFGLDPKVSFGLVATSVFGFLFFAFLINRSYAAGYLKKLLGSFLLGSTVLMLFIVVRFFLSGYEPLAWVARDGWLFIGAVIIFILINLAILESGARRALWTLALAPHFLVLFLWDQTLPWLIILAGSLLVAVFHFIFDKKLRRAKMVYPLQAAALAGLLLFVPIKIFTGSNAPVVSSYSHKDIGQVLKEERLPNLIFGLGAGNSALVMARTNVSFFDPDPSAGAALFASEAGTIEKLGTSEFPGQAKLNNIFASILLEGGLLASLGWFILIAALFVLIWGFYRGHWQALKSSRADEEVELGAFLSIALVLFIISLAFTPWSAAVILVLLLLAGVTVTFFGAEAVAPWRSALSRRWELLSPTVRLWSRRALGALAIIVYLAVVVMSARVALAGREAAAALATDAPGLAFNHWEAAERLNPWNDIYRAKREASRLLTLSSSTSLPEQKEIIESANATFSGIARASVNPIAHWLTARLYVSMETYVEGSLILARGAYLKAIELWPTNVALSTELARLYRFRLDALVSNNLSASDLNQEIQDRLKHALKLSPDYLPARLELAFLMEKLAGLPAAVAELESWEDANPEIRYQLGRLHFNDNKLDIAEEKFKQVLKDVPNHSNAHYSLGVVYFRQKKYKESLKEFETVLEMNPNNEDVKAKIEEVKKKVK